MSIKQQNLKNKKPSAAFTAVSASAKTSADKKASGGKEKKKMNEKQGLTKEEAEKVNDISVEIKNFTGLLIIDIGYWVKTSSKFAKNMLACLRFMNTNDFISDEDEKMFLKGHVLIHTNFEIDWYSNKAEWMKRIKMIKEKKPEAIPAVLEKLEKVRNEKVIARHLADWAAKEIIAEEKKDAQSNI